MITLSSLEIQQLTTVDHKSIALYLLALRPLANVDGIIGFQQKLSLEELGAHYQLTKQQTRTCLEQLKKAGLIERCGAKNKLIFKCAKIGQEIATRDNTQLTRESTLAHVDNVIPIKTNLSSLENNNYINNKNINNIIIKQTEASTTEGLTFDDNEIPTRERWEEFLCHKYRFRLHQLKHVGTMQLLIGWANERVTIGEVRAAIEHAHAVLQEQGKDVPPYYPTYYKNFVKSVRYQQQQEKEAPYAIANTSCKKFVPKPETCTDKFRKFAFSEEHEANIYDALPVVS